MATYYYNKYYFTNTTANTTAWQSWMNMTTGGNLVWQNWTAGTSSANTVTVVSPASIVELTPEEREAQRQAFRDRLREASEAKERATALLRENLTDEQVSQLDRAGRFRVRGSRGGVYEIAHGTAYEIPKGAGRTRSICIHARGSVPEADNMLAKKLMIETDEDEFRRIGNFS